MLKTSLTNALKVLNNQGVIAYPTESVFGLGCDPDSPDALQKILKIKQRPAHKGLILIAANTKQLQDYADFSQLSPAQIARMQATWPGPVTWIVPAKKNLQPLIKGDFESVAVRVTAHPIVSELCTLFNKPIISTSANISGQDACQNAAQVQKMFVDTPLLETIVQASVSAFGSPSQIYDALTGKRLR
ncbi:ribosome maturation factor [Psychromonas sp. CNPT3]|uniref:Sua5/YciO/YrdC/YwlC family protein n=1 Tax=Psychromonas sp. CNPT3 TaxID=314282 RepID=UPI00006E70B8|nr:Sua5/YciO/YrdC/YwlC family protein [Psychromonas sp. CNPT3]AGH80073.1 ribosome maturation factor [Psychromonas sp. CNPT3]